MCMRSTCNELRYDGDVGLATVVDEVFGGLWRLLQLTTSRKREASFRPKYPRYDWWRKETRTQWPWYMAIMIFNAQIYP